MYDGVKTGVRKENEKSEWFDVNIEVHEGLVISPHLFAVELDEVTND